uniref:Uncharacterized protein n=1 Tax=Heliothis virescens TaxID=7102 RepID=A0A2A4JH36_HELVI
MKAIILDHQEQRGDSREESNMREDSSSPVYSMPDEDRTYLTQPDEGGHNCTEPSNVEIIELVDSDDDGNIEAVNATAEGSRVNLEVDLHRGMSSLSLKDTEPLDTTADVNCSQSILNNFEDIGKEIHLEKTTVPSEAVMGNIDAKAKTVYFNQTDKEVILPFKRYNSKTPIVEQTDNLKSKDDSDKTTNPIRTHCTPKSTMTAVTNQPNVIKTTANVLTISPIEKYNTNTNNISVTQRSTWYDSNKTCSINNFGHANVTQPTNTFERANQMNISTAKNLLDLNVGVPINPYSGKENSDHSNTPETLIDQEDPAKTKKKRCPRKKVSNENDMKPKNQRASKPKENRRTGPKKNKTVPIYNRNVENDLSWVENIRYVREIRQDENDTKLIIEDSFWDNYYLPNNWNETDFLY